MPKSNFKTEWLLLSCHECDAEFRIKDKYAHLRGRCPACGTRIEPPRPQEFIPTAFSLAEDPEGLVPLSDEWPEPAVVERHEKKKKNYGVVAKPPAWKDAPPDRPGDADIFKLVLEEQAEKPPPVKKKPGDEDVAYDVPGVNIGPPAEPPTRPSLPDYLRHQSDILDPEEERPEPPPWPLLQGIYEFPFRLRNLRVWLLMAFGIMVLTFFGGMMDMLLQQFGRFALIAMGFVGLGMVWITIITGSYAAAYFLNTVVDTAAGNEDVGWPTEGWRELFFYLVRLVWVLLCTAMIPLGFLISAGMPPLVLASVPMLLFPLGLLSTLAGGFWMLLDPRLLAHLARKPWVLLAIYVHSVILGGIAFGLDYLVTDAPITFAPVAGLVGSALVLIYGRVLGRAVWVLGETRGKNPSRKRERQIDSR